MNTVELVEIAAAAATLLIGAVSAGGAQNAPDSEAARIEERERQAFRSQHGVSLIEEEEEATALNECPDGIWGWATAVTAKASPVFRKRIFQAYEVHRLDGGGSHILGYLKGAEAAAVSEGKETVNVRLFPEPYGDAAAIVSIAYSRLGRMKGPSRIDGNFIDIEVFPAA